MTRRYPDGWRSASSLFDWDDPKVEPWEETIRGRIPGRTQPRKPKDRREKGEPFGAPPGASR